jgi:hypothetical protein
MSRLSDGIQWWKYNEVSRSFYEEVLEIANLVKPTTTFNYYFLKIKKGHMSNLA